MSKNKYIKFLIELTIGIIINLILIFVFYLLWLLIKNDLGNILLFLAFLVFAWSNGQLCYYYITKDNNKNEVEDA